MSNPTPRQCIRIADAYDAGVETAFDVSDNRFVLHRTAKGDRLELEFSPSIFPVKRVSTTKNGGLRIDLEDGTTFTIAPSKEG